MAKQNENTETKTAPTTRTLEVTRKGNIETTRRPNGTVIVNATAESVAEKKGE